MSSPTPQQARRDTWRSEDIIAADAAGMLAVAIAFDSPPITMPPLLPLAVSRRDARDILPRAMLMPRPRSPNRPLNARAEGDGRGKRIGSAGGRMSVVEVVWGSLQWGPCAVAVEPSMAFCSYCRLRVCLAALRCRHLSILYCLRRSCFEYEPGATFANST